MIQEHIQETNILWPTLFVLGISIWPTIYWYTPKKRPHQRRLPPTEVSDNSLNKNLMTTIKSKIQSKIQIIDDLCQTIITPINVNEKTYLELPNNNFIKKPEDYDTHVDSFNTLKETPTDNQTINKLKTLLSNLEDIHRYFQTNLQSNSIQQQLESTYTTFQKDPCRCPNKQDLIIATTIQEKIDGPSSKSFWYTCLKRNQNPSIQERTHKIGRCIATYAGKIRIIEESDPDTNHRRKRRDRRNTQQQQFATRSNPILFRV